MLTFATEFPVHQNTTSSDFLSTMRDWVEKSPFTGLSEGDLADLSPNKEFFKKGRDHSVRSIGIVRPNGEEFVAFRNSTLDAGISWETAVVFSKSSAGSWIGIRTSNESHQPVSKLPAAKKPYAVRLLLQRLGGAVDGALVVSDSPVWLTNNDIDLAARLLNGEAGCRLPVVYLSCGFDGKYAIDPNQFSKDLSGMAHVVVEPNRPFSRRLQIDVSSQNVYGGAVGIYWPQGTGRRKFFSEELDSPEVLKWAITDEVRGALLNRRPLPQCTWEAVESEVRRNEYEMLKSGGSKELSEYVATFDADLSARDRQIEVAEQEIARLQREIVRLQSQEASSVGAIVQPGSEQNLYSGEIASVLGDALRDCADRYPDDSRRGHILRSFANANPSNDIARNNRDRIKYLLRDYRSMDAPTRAGLEALGFSVTEEGKHIKLVYQDDDRYTFILPKSGSDRRGGLNSASDIAKRIF